MRTTPERVIYAGDTSLSGAAAYLAGILTHEGIPFDYLPSDLPIAEVLAAAPPSLVILSDYPSVNFLPGDFDRLTELVHDGTGLLMIGGWESFHGAKPGRGEYPPTPLAEVLPVVMAETDDRVNLAQPCLIEKVAEHSLLGNLPFDLPPGIGGYNRVRAREGATTLLRARQFAVSSGRAGHYNFHSGDASDLLVIGSFGKGRTAAYAGDVAPHWVGGFVDWGSERVVARAPGAGDIEVGSWYARFFASLVRWTGSIK